jgi:hypothetical protein
MSRQIICIFVLAALIIASAGCASRRQYIIKNDITAEELKDVGKVFVTLDDDSTLEFSKVEIEGDILKGTTETGEIKEQNIQDAESIWVERQHGKVGAAFLAGILTDIPLLILLSAIVSD